MTTPVTTSSYQTMNYSSNVMDRPAFAQPPLSYEHQRQPQQQQRQQQHYAGQLVPHYGPAGQQQSYYQNYQIPSTDQPQYMNYASSTVAASNPPDLLEASYGSSSNSYGLEQSPSGNTADDVLAAFETAPAPAGLSSSAPTNNVITSPSPNDAFINSFTKEELAEQERLMKEIEQRKSSMVVPTEVSDVTVYEQQDRLWNSYHEQRNQHPHDSMVPHSSLSYPSTMTVYESNEHMITVPRSHNPTGSDAVHPRRAEMKQARKVKTATAATGGAIVGGVIFGPAWPLGVVVGGAAGAVAGKQLSKVGERRAQRKWEKKNFQHYAASESAVAKGGAAFA